MAVAVRLRPEKTSGVMLADRPVQDLARVTRFQRLWILAISWSFAMVETPIVAMETVVVGVLVPRHAADLCPPRGDLTPRGVSTFRAHTLPCWCWTKRSWCSIA